MRDIVEEVVGAGRVADIIAHCLGVRAGEISAKRNLMCPFHDDSTPSLSIDPDRGLFHCFGCKRKGGLLNLIVLTQPPADLAEAADWLRRWLSSEPARNSKTTWFARLLRDAQAHALRRDSWLTELLDEIGASHAALTRLSGGAFPKDTYGPNRVVLPAFDPNGQLVGLSCRSSRSEPHESHDTHKWTIGKNGLLGGALLASATSKTTCLLCAGDSDLLVATTVAPELLSTSFACGETFPPEFASVFRDRRVVIAYDGDSAGREGAAGAVSALSDVSTDVRVLEWPATWLAGSADADLRAYVSDHDADQFKRLVNRAPHAPMGFVDSLYANSEEDWADVLWIARADRPEFPLHALEVAGLREYVEAETRSVQVPVDLPAMMVLAAISAAIGSKVEVFVCDSYTEQANLYVLIVAATGERKSPIFEHASHPLRLWEQQQIKELSVPRRIALRNVEVCLERIKKTQTRAAGDNVEKAAKAMRELEELEYELAALWAKVPVDPTVLCDNVTAENVATLLDERGGSMAAFSDEGTIISNAVRYSNQGGDAKIENLLKAYGGEEIRVNRGSRGPDSIKRPCLTLAACVQPVFLETLRSSKVMRGRGLLARCYVIAPRSLVGWRHSGLDPVPQKLRQQYHDLIYSLAELPCPRNDQKEYIRHRVSLSSESLELRAAYQDEVEKALREGGDLVEIVDWANKAVGRAVRTAALLHFTRLVGQSEPWKQPIGPEVMAAAIDISRYAAPHYLHAMGLFSGSSAVKHARVILDWLSRHDYPATFLRADLYESRRRSFGDETKHMDEGLDELRQRGYIRSITVERKGSSGRHPSERSKWALNPKVCTQNPKNSAPGRSLDSLDSKSKSTDDDTPHQEVL